MGGGAIQSCTTVLDVGLKGTHTKGGIVVNIEVTPH